MAAARTSIRSAGPHVPFILASLLIALLGGLALAVSLPVQAALQDPVDVSWISHAQVHGHLQTVGFAGLFIVGVSYLLMPGFAGRPLRFPRLVPISLWMLVAAVLLRAFGQPLADHTVFAILLGIGVVLEVAGAACFAANVVGTLGGTLRGGRPFAPLFVMGGFWFLLQAILGGVWLLELASDGGTILEARRTATLVGLQVFGFHLSFILGVVVQAFPGFFGQPRARAAALPAIVLFEAGVAGVLLGRVFAEVADVDWWLLEDLGHVALGVSVLWVGGFSGWWRGWGGMSRIGRRFAAVLWPAMLWLALVGLLSVVFGVQALVDGALPGSRELDTTLHVATIGVVLMLILGMAQLMLPEFASERIAGGQGSWRGPVFGIGLSLAVVLRAGGRYFAEDLGRAGSQWSMALAGSIALILTLVFAVLVVRSNRQHRDFLANVASRLPPVR